MGTPDFSVPALDALVAAGHEIAAVYTQPPRPAGRGQKDRPVAGRTPGPRRWAFRVRHPKTLRDARGAGRLRGASGRRRRGRGLWADPAAARARRAAHGLPQHPRLAPAALARRGADPSRDPRGRRRDRRLHHADGGGARHRPGPPARGDADRPDRHDRRPARPARRPRRAADRRGAGPARRPSRRARSPKTGVTYAAKIDKAEAAIDWTRPAPEIDRQIRGLSPFPGAWTTHEGRRLKLLRSRVADGQGAPGEVLHGLTIACGAGATDILEVQAEGRARQDAASFLRGTPIAPGTRLGGQ